MNQRQKRINEISARLGRRKLIWFGTRGTDALPLLEIPQFAASFSIIAPLDALTLEKEECLETISGKRVDLDTYSLDYDQSPPAQDFIGRLFDYIDEPCVVIPYRPLSSFADIYYPIHERIEYLGMFHERQAPFEYKPWVETELAKAGLKTIPWEYCSRKNKTLLAEYLEKNGPHVVRPNRSNGGEGIILARSESDIDKYFHTFKHDFVAASIYLKDSISLNVNACVYPDGYTSMHGPSFQLIGKKGFTTREFGYCGNDFSGPSKLDKSIIYKFEAAVTQTGIWLAKNGYIGAFGLDALVHNDQLYVVEINPRFQGSSQISARLDATIERPDIYQNHMAAFLGLNPIKDMSLWEIACKQEKVFQVYWHNCREDSFHVNSYNIVNDEVEHMLFPAPSIKVCKMGVAFKMISSNLTLERLRPMKRQNTRDELWDKLGNQYFCSNSKHEQLFLELGELI